MNDKTKKAAFDAAVAEANRRRANYTRRVAAEWSGLAGGEPVEVEYVKGTFYGYTTELGALRLFHRYNRKVRNTGTRADYSANLQTWFFALDTKYTQL
jgi:hypothetical protein